MLVREIIHTCSNVHVARAALASIGGDVAARVTEKARAAAVTEGAFVAHMVKDFSHRAGEEDWDSVDEAARGADQPILSGLRQILVSGMARDAIAIDTAAPMLFDAAGRPARAAWPDAAAFCRH